MTKGSKVKTKNIRPAKSRVTNESLPLPSSSSPPPCNISSRDIKGMDDAGNFYNSHSELIAEQTVKKGAYYLANDIFWASGGYNGKTDDEAMVGDTSGLEDGADGLAFLDRYLAILETQDSQWPKYSKQRRRFDHGVDLGAGAGRVTKLVLLKRYEEVRLVEGNESWSKRSRTYLGNKRANRCSFVNCRLDKLTEADIQAWGKPADIMWVQWTLQYLIDVDVVDCLRRLSAGLRQGSGILVVKENRPYGNAREDRFQMDTPGGDNMRYDITRSDLHHRLLFHQAGLKVNYTERGDETNTYALALSVT